MSISFREVLNGKDYVFTYDRLRSSLSLSLCVCSILHKHDFMQLCISH